MNEPETNYFGRLLEVMTNAEIKMYVERLALKGEVRTAGCLMDELAERGYLTPRKSEMSGDIPKKRNVR